MLPQRCHRNWLYTVACAAAFLLPVLQLQLHGQNTPAPGLPLPRSQPTVLFIGRLNFDAVPDTVIGTLFSGFQPLPTQIRWGRTSGNKQDTARNSKDIPESLKVAVTTFKYPLWHKLTGSVAIESINADSASDIVLYIHGVVSDTVPSGGQGRGAASPGPGKDVPERWHGLARANDAQARDAVITVRDTMRAVVIFGQNRLQTLDTLDIARMAARQSAPVTTSDIIFGQDAVDPQVRDMSGLPSYKLPRVNADIRQGDTLVRRGRIINGGTTPAIGAAVRLSPASVEDCLNQDAQDFGIGGIRILPHASCDTIGSGGSHVCSGNPVCAVLAVFLYVRPLTLTPNIFSLLL